MRKLDSKGSWLGISVISCRKVYMIHIKMKINIFNTVIKSTLREFSACWPCFLKPGGHDCQLSTYTHLVYIPHLISFSSLVNRVASMEVWNKLGKYDATRYTVARKVIWPCQHQMFHSRNQHPLSKLLKNYPASTLVLSCLIVKTNLVHSYWY